jgi:group I intron endonuclease
MAIYKVYKITNTVNGKIYIGATKNSFKTRWNQHKSDAKRGDTRPFYRAIKKYGHKKFKMTLLYTAPSEKEMYEKERFYIAKHNSNSRKIGYNLSEGGEGNNSGKTWAKGLTKETHPSLMSISQKQSGSGNFWFGKKHTKKWKKNHSNKIKGKNHPNWNKDLLWLVELNKNRIWTDEAKGKISKANSIPIICLELNREFPSITVACKELKIDNKQLIEVLKGRRRQVKGFSFRYIDKKLNKIADKTRKEAKNLDKLGHRTAIFCNENGKTYSSMEEASKDLDIACSTIYRYLNGKFKTAKGFTFRRL